MESDATADPGSLQSLHDVILPEPIGLWPPAPGWYAVFAVLGLIVVWALVRWLLSWRRSAYRREALARLDAMSGAGEGIEQIASLMKRVALTAYPRERVAGLSGTDWLAFLDRTGRTNEFTSGPGKGLGAEQYREHGTGEAAPGDLVGAAARWIRNHHDDPEG